MAGTAAHTAESAAAKAASTEAAAAEPPKTTAAVGRAGSPGGTRGRGRRRTAARRPGPSGRARAAGPEVAAQAPAKAEGERIAQKVAEHQNQHHHGQRPHQDEHAQVHDAAIGRVCGGGLAAGQVHAVDVRDGAGHRIGAGAHRGVIVAGGEIVLHRLGQGAGLPVDGGVAEAVAVRQVIVAVGIEGGLHHQQEQNAVVVLLTADAPGVERLQGVFLGGGAAGVLDRQHPDLCAGTAGFQLAVQLFEVGGGVL